MPFTISSASIGPASKNKPHRLIAAGAAAWCGAILLAPVLDSAALYQLFSVICHQDPARSWHLASGPLAVCIRCSGLYLGVLAGVLGRFKARSGLLRAAAVFLGAEFLVEWLTGAHLEALRMASGLLFGLAAAGFLEAGVSELLVGRRRAQPLRGAS